MPRLEILYLATAYGLHCRGVEFESRRVLKLFALHTVQKGSWAHQSSYPTGTGNCFPGSKDAGA
jgi:hypothetical protein